MQAAPLPSVTDKLQTVNELQRRRGIILQMHRLLGQMNPHLLQTMWKSHVDYFNEIHLMVYNDIYDMDLIAWLLIHCETDQMFIQLCILCNVSMTPS